MTHEMSEVNPLDAAAPRGGEPRNRYAETSHGFLTHDGDSAAAISDEARREVLDYPTVHWVEGTVQAVQAEGSRYTVTQSSGETFPPDRDQVTQLQSRGSSIEREPIACIRDNRALYPDGLSQGDVCTRCVCVRGRGQALRLGSVGGGRRRCGWRGDPSVFGL